MRRRRLPLVLLALIAALVAALALAHKPSQPLLPPLPFAQWQRAAGRRPSAAEREAFLRKLIEGALAQTKEEVIYDPSYVVIPYPGGDVPRNRGVCSDVIVRAYRAAGVDLQKEVHLDMKKNFSKYPKRWGLKRPDPNIDHRRVANLMTFFARKGTSLPRSRRLDDYLPGDLVAWDLGRGVLHIGLVSDRKSLAGRYLVVHNIGAGPRLEDVLFDWKIIGHYRYPGS